MLLLTVLAGTLFPIARAMGQRQFAGFLIHLHTLETFRLGNFFLILNGNRQQFEGSDRLSEILG